MVNRHIEGAAWASHWFVDPRHRKEILFTNAVENFDWPDDPLTRASGLVERTDKRVGN
jgi:hypothetical protein